MKIKTAILFLIFGILSTGSGLADSPFVQISKGGGVIVKAQFVTTKLWVLGYCYRLEWFNKNSYQVTVKGTVVLKADGVVVKTDTFNFPINANSSEHSSIMSGLEGEDYISADLTNPPRLLSVSLSGMVYDDNNGSLNFSGSSHENHFKSKSDTGDSQANSSSDSNSSSYSNYSGNSKTVLSRSANNKNPALAQELFHEETHYREKGNNADCPEKKRYYYAWADYCHAQGNSYLIGQDITYEKPVIPFPNCATAPSTNAVNQINAIQQQSQQNSTAVSNAIMGIGAFIQQRDAEGEQEKEQQQEQLQAQQDQQEQDREQQAEADQEAAQQQQDEQQRQQAIADQAKKQKIDSLLGNSDSAPNDSNASQDSGNDSQDSGDDSKRKQIDNLLGN